MDRMQGEAGPGGRHMKKKALKNKGLAIGSTRKILVTVHHPRSVPVIREIKTQFFVFH